MSAEDVKLIEEINADEGSAGSFQFSARTGDGATGYTKDLTPDALIAGARRAGIPADAQVNPYLA